MRINLKIPGLLILLLFFSKPVKGFSQNETKPFFKDRGPGLATSLFGTYVEKGELLIYPFFEYSYDHNREYQPREFGFGPNKDFIGKYKSTQAQIFLAYGFTDWLALELEASYLNAVFDKSPSDTYITQSQIKQNGFTDIEWEIRTRLMNENENQPEIYSYLEVTAPSQKNKLLIGDAEWDFKPGVGVIRGFSWGTLTFRTDLEYNREAKGIDLGETALEYLKKLAPQWRLFLAVEGGETGALDEWDFVSGIQWRISDNVFLNLIMLWEFHQKLRTGQRNLV